MFALIILSGIALFFYINQVTGVTVQTGKYYDESGKELGYCKIEGKFTRLATVPENTTYYFTPTDESIGYCKGVSSGCFQSSSGPASPICSPVNLQTSCDSKIYPNLLPGHGVTAKYLCIIDR